MANRSEAYDFSLFEERNAAVVLQPQIEEQPQRRSAVVELPEQEPERRPQRRTRPSPLRMVVATLCFMVVFATGIIAVYSDVQLTELNDHIGKTRNALEEAESLEVQLTMQAAQRMTDAQIEEYAVRELGMGKMTGSQVVYLHVAQEDKGTVVQDIDGGSWLDQLFAQIGSWMAG